MTAASDVWDRGARRRTMEEFWDDFWARVDKSSGCWVWTGYTNGHLYGRVTPPGGRARLVHRVVWEFFNGPIPDGLSVCHRCDNPPCVNPEHLFVGTHTDNMRDMFAKGRRGPRYYPPRSPTCKRGHDRAVYSRTAKGTNAIYCARCHAEREAARRKRVAL